MCTGVQYTFDFDYMFNNQPYDIYMYATLYYDDGTSQGVFGDRTYGDSAAIGKKHASLVEIVGRLTFVQDDGSMDIRLSRQNSKMHNSKSGQWPAITRVRLQDYLNALHH